MDFNGVARRYNRAMAELRLGEWEVGPYVKGCGEAEEGGEGHGVDVDC